jgi:hypothetical protein
MTYLEKLLELNQRTLKNATLLFAAKHRLENEEEKPTRIGSRIQMLKVEINKLIFNYQESLTASQNMISFVNLNHIDLKATFSTVVAR